MVEQRWIEVSKHLRVYFTTYILDLKCSCDSFSSIVSSLRWTGVTKSQCKLESRQSTVLVEGVGKIKKFSETFCKIKWPTKRNVTFRVTNDNCPQKKKEGFISVLWIIYVFILKKVSHPSPKLYFTRRLDRVN